MAKFSVNLYQLSINLYQILIINEYVLTLIKCLGGPPHGWTCEIFKKIGECWEQVILLDQNAEMGLDFSFAKVLIKIEVFPFIQGWVSLSINSVDYGVFVKELGKVVVGGYKKQDHHSSSGSNEDKLLIDENAQVDEEELHIDKDDQVAMVVSRGFFFSSGNRSQ